MERSALIDKCDPSIDPLACNALTRIMCPGENGQRERSARQRVAAGVLLIPE